MLQEVEVKCPYCESNEKDVSMFGADLFEYKCLKCKEYYQVQYARIPVEVKKLSQDKVKKRKEFWNDLNNK